MTVAGVEGADPSRSSAVAASAASGITGVGTSPQVGGVGTSSRSSRGGGRHGGFDNPELTSGLLSDNITPVQRDGLGRLARFLRMQPRELLDALRTGTGLGFLLTARRLAPSSLFGMFDKGLLIDAQA